MKRMFSYLTLASLICFALAIPVWAHHSFASEYDMQKPIEVHGTVVEVQFINPHVHFVLDAKDANGQVQRWSFEAGTPSGLIRYGFTKNTLKPGAEVTIRGFAAKDAEDRGMLRELVMPDGKVLNIFGTEAAK